MAWAGQVGGGVVMGGGLTWRRPLLNTPFSSSKDQIESTPTSSGINLPPEGAHHAWCTTTCWRRAPTLRSVTPQHGVRRWRQRDDRTCRRLCWGPAWSCNAVRQLKAQGEVTALRVHVRFVRQSTCLPRWHHGVQREKRYSSTHLYLSTHLGGEWLTSRSIYLTSG